jgi:hypothetical protein
MGLRVAEQFRRVATYRGLRRRATPGAMLAVPRP